MIGAIILAAGLSTRMGAPKLVLPWGKTTVIGRVVEVLWQVGVTPQVVVTGGAHHQVEATLQGSSARVVFNPRYNEDQMLLSLQVGLAELPDEVEAFLLALGDQPQIQPGVVQAILQAYQQSHALLVAPSFAGRRGHPWLAARPLWGELATLQPPVTLREWLNRHVPQTLFVDTHSDAVLRDLDTPQDYERERPAIL